MLVEAQTLCVLVLQPNLVSRMADVEAGLRWVFKVISSNGSEITRISRPSMCIEFDSSPRGSWSLVVEIAVSAYTRAFAASSVCTYG